MDSSRTPRRRTRREFLGDAIWLGTGAAALAALSPRAALPVFAQGGPPERVKVLLDDLVESTAADFARGQARGVEIAVEAGRATLRGKLGGEFTSGVVSLPFSATHLGLHWIVRDAAPEAVTVELRTSGDGITWSNWQRLTIEAVADLPAGREVFAALAEGRRGRAAQYRVRFQSDQTATVDRVTVTAINSADGPREPLATAAATTAVFTAADGSSITVISREGWGCDESLRFRGKTEIWPEMYVPAKKVVLHHTATSNNYSDGAAEVRAVYAYHARTLGWGDIGYNSLIDRSGLVYEGRHGRGEGSLREILSADVVAGHVSSHNYGSTGIAAIGNFETGAPTDVMLSSIDNVATFECGRHFIDPAKASDFLRSDDTWHLTLNNVSGHYESYATECPGAALKGYLPTLCGHVAARLGASSSPDLSSTSQREQTEPGSLSFSWPSSAIYCLEGWYKPPTSDNISYLSGYGSGGYNDSLAKAQVWTGPATIATFTRLAAGHYTMHMRTSTGKYEANLTFLVKKSSSSSKPPKK